jgi:hypothetical protein
MAFLRDVDLQERVFYHQPLSRIQLRGYVKAVGEK